MAVLVGFTGTEGGKDAFAFGALLARTWHTHLEVTMILPEDRLTTTGSDDAYEELVQEQARAWMADVTADTEDIEIRTHLRKANNPVSGLIAACEEFEPECLVIGAGRHGHLGKVSLGSVGQNLIYSAPVPLGLAPRGSRNSPIQRISEITVGIGDRRGTPHLLHVAADLASKAKVGVRLVSIQENPKDREDPAQLQRIGEETVAEAAEKIRRQLGRTCPLRTEVAIGKDITAATEAIDWKPDSIALLGSSKLASPRRLFLGSVANKVLRSLPVPLIMVPSEG